MERPDRNVVVVVSCRFFLYEDVGRALPTGTLACLVRRCV